MLDVRRGEREEVESSAVGLGGVRYKLSMLLFLAMMACSPPVSPPAQRAAVPSPGRGSMRVATWNVEWLDGREGRGVRPRSASDYAALAAVVSGVEADVWSFQEVLDETAVRRLVGPDWTVYVESRRADQRVAMAVRPGLTATFSEVEDISVGRRGLRRGVVATVDGVDILGIHLKAGCQWDPLDRGDDCVTVGRQLEEVEEWLDGRTGTAVVIGDWNRQLTGRDAGWLNLNDGTPVPLVAPLLDASDDCPGSRHRHPIDHAVVRGITESDVRARQVRDAASSDHCPVVVDLTR
jgi:endonuclease/exonuclease/phosphatase family metal-dependent hydrolase